MKSGGDGRVLVIGDDMRIFLSVARALGRAGRTVEAFPYGPSPALKSRYVSRIHAAPVFDEGQAVWNAALLDVLHRENFDLVIPCSDPAIIFLDSNRSSLEHQRLAIPPESAMAVFYDKQQTHDMCDRLGIPMAKSALLTTKDTVDDLITAYGVPLVLKPRRTFFAGKEQAREIVEIAEDRGQLEKLMATITDPSRYLVEQFFVGDGVGVSVLAQDGKILQAFQHRRLREGRGGASSYRISEQVDPALRSACMKVLDYTRHSGVCMFEFRKNPSTGRWILIETNARFWGSMALPLALGLDYPNRLFDMMVNGIAGTEMPYAVGIRSRNLMLDGLNLLRRIRALRRGGIGEWLVDVGDYALQPLRWLQGTERSDSFVADDLRPAWWEFTALAIKLGNLLRGNATGRKIEKA